MKLAGVWENIEHVADIRRTNNRTPRHIDVAYLEVIGAAGELAARHFLGLPTKLHQGFDHGKDFVWRGWKVDVKATKLTPLIAHRYLQWPVEKLIKADIILLMAVDQTTTEVVPIGWATAREILNAPINTSRRVPCYEIPVTELRPFWEMFAILPRNGSELQTEV